MKIKACTFVYNILSFITGFILIFYGFILNTQLDTFDPNYNKINNQIGIYVISGFVILFVAVGCNLIAICIDNKCYKPESEYTEITE